jgi:hypothetical protein
MVSSVSLEQIDVRKLQGAYISPFSFPPRASYMYDLIRLYNETERLSKMQLDSFDTEIPVDLQRLQELNQRRITAVRDTVHANQMRETWSHWQNVAQYVASSATIALGVGCVTSGVGVIPGWLLIGSGALGLTNRAAVDSGALEWALNRVVASSDLARKTAARIDVALTSTSTVLAIAATIGAYHAGALTLLAATKETAFNRALTILSATSTGVSAATQFSGKLIDRRISNCKANLTELEATTTLAHNEIQTATDQILNIIKCSEEISRVVKRVIDSSIV